jgi:hypothetical protein
MLEEINLNPSGPTSKATLSPGKNAEVVAKAVASGTNWRCSRVKSWVNLDECTLRYAEARYAEARGAGSCYSPCLECSTIAVHLRAMGQRTPVYITEENPQPTIQEETTMTKPAKKGTPDPIIEEVKAAAEPKLEIVAKPAPEVKEKAAANPFAGWDQYSPGSALRGKLDVFASFTAAGILSLSVAAQEQIKLQLYSSVDVLHANGKIGLRLHPDKKGALSIVAKTKSRSSATVSARGFLRQFKLEGVCGKRFAVREIAPGFVEIDLRREVAA